MTPRTSASLATLAFTVALAGAARACDLGEVLATFEAHRAPLDAYAVRYHFTAGFRPATPDLGQSTTVDLRVAGPLFHIRNETLFTEPGTHYTLQVQWAGDGAAWVRYDSSAAAALVYADEALFAREQAHPFVSDLYRHLLGFLPYTWDDGAPRTLLETLHDPSAFIELTGTDEDGRQFMTIRVEDAIAGAADALITVAPGQGLVIGTTLVGRETGVPIVEYEVTGTLDAAPGLEMPTSGIIRHFDADDGSERGSIELLALTGEHPILVGESVEAPASALEILPPRTVLLQRETQSTQVSAGTGHRDRARLALFEAGLPARGGLCSGDGACGTPGDARPSPALAAVATASLAGMGFIVGRRRRRQASSGG